MLEADHLLYPRLRPVEAFPVQINGQDLICVRDPEALAEQPLYLNQLLMFLVSRMDGRHGLRDIQADFFRAAGEILPMDKLEHFVTQLDEQHYLIGPSFQSFYSSLVETFRNASSRPARHAGTAYEERAEALASQLQGYASHSNGPRNDSIGDVSAPLRGLIAPHIDFHRGGPTYAHAYQALALQPDADTYIIFGTCHAPMPQRFSVSKKNYETPLGAVGADQDFINRLSIRLDKEYADDFPHRAEHSIEFQTVFLKYILPNEKPFKIVPILVNTFHDIYSEGRTAREDQEINTFVNSICETMRESQGRICVIAGADLAHVGRRFGDTAGPTERSLLEVEKEDRRFLKLVEEGDAEGVFQSIASDNDARRVCGYPPIYLTLRCIERPRGKLLQYRQWSDLDAGAAVTYAAVALF